MASVNGKTLEGNLWTWLKAGATLLRTLHLERVDLPRRADVEGIHRGSCFWIETKTAHRPAREATPVRVKFEPGQVEWLKGRRRYGALAWVLVQVGSGAGARRYLIDGRVADAVEAGAPEAELAELSVTPPYAPAEVIIEAASEVWRREGAA